MLEIKFAYDIAGLEFSRTAETPEKVCEIIREYLDKGWFKQIIEDHRDRPTVFTITRKELENERN